MSSFPTSSRPDPYEYLIECLQHCQYPSSAPPITDNRGKPITWEDRAIELLEMRPSLMQHRNACGGNLLHDGIGCNASDFVNKVLERNGTDARMLNTADETGETPLQLAIRLARITMAYSLVAHGADARVVRKSDKATTLHLLACAPISEKEQPQVTKLAGMLISRGADVTAQATPPAARGEEGKPQTAAHMARARQQTALAAFLEARELPQPSPQQRAEAAFTTLFLSAAKTGNATALTNLVNNDRNELLTESVLQQAYASVVQARSQSRTDDATARYDATIVALAEIANQKGWKLRPPSGEHAVSSSTLGQLPPR